MGVTGVTVIIIIASVNLKISYWLPSGGLMLQGVTIMLQPGKLPGYQLENSNAVVNLTFTTFTKIGFKHLQLK